jgi:hypothetical protein
VVTLATINSIPVSGQLTVLNVNPGAAYRYVRFVGGTQWVNIAEMQVDGVATPMTLTKLTGAPIGTAGYSAASTPAAAFDGNLSTYFDAADGNLNDWVGLDLRVPQTIQEIQFAPRPGYEFRMYGGQFQASSSATFTSNVVNLYTVTAIPTSGQLTSVMVSAPGQYRYVRYVGGTQWVNIAEMVVQGVYNAPPVSSKLSGTPIGTASPVSSTSLNQVFDGDFTTYFDDPTDSTLSDWVGIDLGAQHTITQIQFAPRVGYEFRMYGGQFQVSNDPTFTTGVVTIYTINAIPTAGQFTSVQISAPGTYRYVRYVGGTQWVNIAEMEVDGY